MGPIEVMGTIEVIIISKWVFTIIQSVEVIIMGPYNQQTMGL